MKKVKRDELRSEYRREDLGKGVRGKFLKAYRAGTNLVLLQPEVAAVFPTDRAVNKALSSLIEVAEHAGITLMRPPSVNGNESPSTKSPSPIVPQAVPETARLT